MQNQIKSLLLWGLLITTFSCFAAPPPGQFYSGHAQNLNFTPFSFKNREGFLFPQQPTWSNSGQYDGYVSCRGVNVSPVFFTAQYALPAYGNDGFYRLNDYLAIKTSLFIRNRGYKDLPFSHISNQSPQYCYSPQSFESGIRGKMQIKLIKPIRGRLDLTKILVARLYAQKESRKHYQIDKSYPLMNLYLSLNLLSPQSCTFQTEKNISINFGDISQADFTKVGIKPSSVKAQSVNLSYSCEGIAGNNKIKAHLTSSPDQHDPKSTNTSMSGIGIRVEQDGRIVKPNTNLKSTYNKNSGKGDVSFELYPVKTSDKMGSGKLNSNMEIRIDVQ